MSVESLIKLEDLQKVLPQSWPWNQLQLFINTICEWNLKVNLISRKDIHAIVANHLAPSLAIGSIIPFTPGSRILDVGTGGGFPGLPLAICFPKVHFTLIDSVGKKLKVLQSIIEVLELKNVTLVNMRVEDFKPKFDFVIGRAVTNLTQFWQWTAKNIAYGGNHSVANGILYLKGGEFELELQALPATYKLYVLDTIFKDLYTSDKYLIHIIPRR